MALQAYLKIKNSEGNQIFGSVTQQDKAADQDKRGRFGKIAVIAVSHEIVAPRDAATGLPTGKRMHKPFVITKELDKATPRLYQALVTNDNLKEWEPQFWTPQVSAKTATGQEVQHYMVTLTNATVASIIFRMPNNRHPELMQFNEYEEVAFTYQKIRWDWHDGGIQAEDDWQAPC